MCTKNCEVLNASSIGTISRQTRSNGLSLRVSGVQREIILWALVIIYISYLLVAGVSQVVMLILFSILRPLGSSAGTGRTRWAIIAGPTYPKR